MCVSISRFYFIHIWIWIINGDFYETGIVSYFIKSKMLNEDAPLFLYITKKEETGNLTLILCARYVFQLPFHICSLSCCLPWKTMSVVSLVFWLPVGSDQWETSAGHQREGEEWGRRIFLPGLHPSIVPFTEYAPKMCFLIYITEPLFSQPDFYFYIYSPYFLPQRILICAICFLVDDKYINHQLLDTP